MITQQQQIIIRILYKNIKTFDLGVVSILFLFPNLCEWIYDLSLSVLLLLLLSSPSSVPPPLRLLCHTFSVSPPLPHFINHTSSDHASSASLPLPHLLCHISTVSPPLPHLLCPTSIPLLSTLRSTCGPQIAYRFPAIGNSPLHLWSPNCL